MHRTSLALASLLLIACSSSTTSTNGASSSGGASSSSSGGSTPVSTEDCTAKCEPKAKECGAPENQVAEACATVCSSATQEQLACLESKSCDALNEAGSIEKACPKGTSTGSSSSSSGSSGSSGTKKALGDACTCASASASGEGSCAGTDEECGDGLSCVYSAGSSGKGTCMGKRCCDDTNACDDDKSLLEPCSEGTCKSAPLGYYCQK